MKKRASLTNSAKQKKAIVNYETTHLKSLNGQKEKRILREFIKACIKYGIPLKKNKLHIIGVPEREQREKGAENLFEAIMTEKF